MELSKQQQEYLLARELGTNYQRKLTAILFTVISGLKNSDKPTGVATDTDFIAEIHRILKTYKN